MSANPVKPRRVIHIVCALVALTVAVGCSSTDANRSSGTVSAAVTANSQVGYIDVTVTLGGQQVYYSGLLVASPDGDDRKTASVTFALPANTGYVAVARAFDMSQTLAGTSLEQSFDVTAGEETDVMLVIDLSTGGTNAGNVDITARTDFAPVFHVAWSATGGTGTRTLDYTSTDQDPGDTAAYFSIILAGTVDVGDDSFTFADGSNPFTFDPNEGDYTVLAGVVDSLGRADMWELQGNGDSGALTPVKELQGYAVSPNIIASGGFRRLDAGDQLGLIVMADADGAVSAIIDSGSVNGSDPTLPAADLRSLGGPATIASIDVASDGSITIGVRDGADTTTSQHVVFDGDGNASWDGTQMSPRVEGVGSRGAVGCGDR